MLGNMPQLKGDSDKDIIALYDYVLALRRELYDLLNNLDDDNFRKITAKSIDTSTLVVGDNILMGDNAVISWGQVDDAPIVYSADDIRNTIITPTWIGTLGLLVGEHIQMGSNATISWGNVTSQPFIPQNASDVGALPNDSPKLTWIGATGIYTGTINADNITTGTLSADRISTEISRVNKNLSLGGGYKTSSSLSFDGIGSIDAHDNNLFFSAMEGIVFQTPTSFGTVFFDGYTDFSNASVTGLKVRLG